MKAICRALALALVLAPAASFATKVPIPIEGATLNVSFQIQSQFLVNEAGNPLGDGPSFDFFVRRTRLLINGDAGNNWSYLVQLDNANFGKYGNFTGRAIIQDAWVGWAPTGITGGTVLYVDAGILLMPISRHMLQSTTNFITADAQTDGFRFPGIQVPAFRNTGVQVRGWAMNKKIGFRGGVYEGYAPATGLGGAPANVNSTVTPGAVCVATTPGSCVTPKRNPMVAGFINFDIIGSEEGGWLYGDYKWGKEPILSVSLSANYQSQALKNAFQSLTDNKVFSAGAYFDMPMGENEIVAEGTAYMNGNGTGSANTGLGLSGALGVRIGFFAPYVAYDYFSASECDTSLSQAQLDICRGTSGKLGTVGSAESRNFKAGLNFFFNKNTNHLNVEFGVNHGTSAYGPNSISVANAGYAPLALDPAAGSTARRPISSVLSMAAPAYKSLVFHWNFIF